MKKKLLSITLLFVILTNVFMPIVFASATDVDEEYIQSLLDMIPNTMNIDIPEIEHEKSSNEIQKNIKVILENNNINYTIDSNNNIELKNITYNGRKITIYASGYEIYLRDIRKAYVSIGYIKSKTIDLVYNNTNNRNSEDEQYIKNLELTSPKYYEIDLELISKDHETALKDFFSIISEYYNNQINDSSIVAKADCGAGENGLNILNGDANGTYLALFKNGILYDIRAMGVERGIPVINVPSTVKDNEINDYVINEINTHKHERLNDVNITNITEGTKDIYALGIDIPDGYTITSNVDGYINKEAIIIRREENTNQTYTLEELLALVPDTMNLDIPEVEFEQASYIIMNNIKNILDNEGITTYGDKEELYLQVTKIKDATTTNGHEIEIKVGCPALFYGDREHFEQVYVEVSGVEGNVFYEYKYKNIEINYNNSGEYNLNDEQYVKNIELTSPKYYEVSLDFLQNTDFTTVWSAFYEIVEDYYTNQINNDSIIVKATTGAGEGGLNVVTEEGGTFIGLFKNGILYDIKVMGTERSVPVINVPNTIEENNINSYVISEITKYNKNLGENIVSIEKGTKDLYLLDIDIENGYTIKFNNNAEDAFGEGAIIIRREEQTEPREISIEDIVLGNDLNENLIKDIEINNGQIILNYDFDILYNVMNDENLLNQKLQEDNFVYDCFYIKVDSLDEEVEYNALHNIKINNEKVSINNELYLKIEFKIAELKDDTFYVIDSCNGNIQIQNTDLKAIIIHLDIEKYEELNDRVTPVTILLSYSNSISFNDLMSEEYSQMASMDAFGGSITYNRSMSNNECYIIAYTSFKIGETINIKDIGTLDYVKEVDNTDYAKHIYAKKITDKMIFNNESLQLQILQNNAYGNFKWFFEVTSNEFAGGDGTEENPYLISTPQQLYNINNHLDASYKLTKDIDLTFDTTNEEGLFYNEGKGWIAIGATDTWYTFPNLESFSGVFDGNNKKIIGLTQSRTIYKTNSIYNYGGLFAKVTGKIKNLELENVNISIKYDEENKDTTSTLNEFYIAIGSLTTVLQGEIDNIKTTGHIELVQLSEAQNLIHSWSDIGGIVGYAPTHYQTYKYGTINNCKNYINVETNSTTSVNVGGIVGTMEGGTLNSNVNYGNIVSNNISTVGGIAGRMHSYDSINLNIDNCKNYGDLEGYEVGGITGQGSGNNLINLSNYGTIKASFCGGGIIGFTAIEILNFEQNLNIGNVYAKYRAGGLIGVLDEGDIKNSFNAGNIFITKENDESSNVLEVTGGLTGTTQGEIVNSYNTGNIIYVNNYNNNYLIGELAVYYKAISNSYYTIDEFPTMIQTSPSNGMSRTIGGTKLNDNEKYLQNSYEGFDFENIWTIDENSKYKLPQLINNKLDEEWLNQLNMSKNINDLEVNIDLTQKEYTGNEIETTITIMDEDYTLIDNKDYEVTYLNNIEPGTATITITGKGDYEGTITEEFEIIKKEYTSQELLNLIPNQMTLNINEIEFEQAETLVKNNIVAITGLNASSVTCELKGYRYWMTSDELDIRNMNIKISKDGQTKNKDIELIYSNSSDWNDEDLAYVNSVVENTNFDRTWGFELDHSIEKVSFETDTDFSWNKVINDETISTVYYTEGSGGFINYIESGNLCLFRNGVLYKTVTGTKSDIPTITIPDEIEDKDGAYENYATDILQRYLNEEEIDLTIDCIIRISENDVVYNYCANNFEITDHIIIGKNDEIKDYFNEKFNNESPNIDPIIQDIVYTKNDYSCVYDGNGHGIQLQVETQNTIIKYMDENGEYTLDEMPTYSDVGTYTIKYKISKENYNTVTDSNIVNIYGIRNIDTSLKTKNNILIVKKYVFNTQSIYNKFDIFALTSEFVHLDKNKDTITSDLIKTGEYIKLLINNEELKEYVVAILGDVNGDGKISALDYVKIKNHIMKTTLINGDTYLEAADVNEDGKISALDYVRIKNYIMNGGN